MAAVAVVSILVFAYVIYDEEAKHTKTELVTTGMFVARILAAQAAEPVLRDDRPALARLTDAFETGSSSSDLNSFVDYVLIFHRSGELLIQNGHPPYAVQPGGSLQTAGDSAKDAVRQLNSRLFEVREPIIHEKDAVGELRLGISEHQRFELLDAVQRKTLVALAGLSLGAVMVGVYLARRFLRPLPLLTQSARKIGDQLWGETVPVSGSDEIGELARTFNDMSMRLKRAFEESQQATERLVQADKFAALGSLSTTLAHELKNPLTSVKMIMEAAIDKDRQVDCTREDFDVMLHEVQRMEGALNQVLALAGPQRLELREQDINQVIRDVFALTRHRLEIGGVRASLELDETVPPFTLDAKRMEQVLLNLIVNAVEAMPRGGKLVIRTGWTPSPPRVHIAIQDNGMGIPAAIRGRVFDPFFTSKENGTGIGLSVVYTLVREQGGEIDLESQEGAGTIFRITFPVQEEGADAPDLDRR
jgi:signal transduction histidine kinase